MALTVFLLLTSLACHALSAETPVEKTLWEQGRYPVTGLTVGDSYIDWGQAAYHSLHYIPINLTQDGGIRVFGQDEGYAPLRVFTCDKPIASILDVAGTACAALGIEGDLDGKPLRDVNASQVVVLYVDALGFDRYRWASSLGATGNISSAGEPVIAYAMYPSISRVNAAAFATGVRPEKNGIDHWENTTIKVPTVIDLATKKGVKAVWVDGMKPPVMLDRGIVSVPDADGDGSSDNEVAARAIDEYEKGTRLIYVHLVGPDKALHATGPYSQGSIYAIMDADALAGRVMSRLKPGTLLIIAADHGGHDIEGCAGDHGTLLPQDILIPIFLKKY